MSSVTYPRGQQRSNGWRWWLIMGVLLVVVALLMTGKISINLLQQDSNISAPAGSPGPNDPCGIFDKQQATYDDLMLFRRSGGTLFRLEKPWTFKSVGMATPQYDAYIRYTSDGNVHVAFVDMQKNWSGFRMSAETFHRELGAINDPKLIDRVYHLSTNLPAGTVTPLDGIGEAMDFLQWIGFICRGA